MDELLEKLNEEYGPKFDALTSKANELGEKLKSDDGDADELKSQLSEVEKAVKSLTDDRDAELRQIEFKAMATKVESLSEALSATKDADSDFSLGGLTSSEEQKAAYGSDSDHSFFVDARNTAKGYADARERWEEALGEKAMTSAQGTTGGFLVPPQVSDQILGLREQSNILRPLFSKINVHSDTLRIAQVTNGLLAGWVAELAEKPLSDLAFGEISVNTFTKAGMSVVSNQLLRDSNPSVDRLIYQDLAKRLAALEEIAFLSGSGNGQPLGILNTPGVQTTDLSSTDVDDFLDAIVDAITDIYTAYFGAPNGIVMHPRDWGRIVKARKADATSEYVVGPPGNRSATDSLPGYGQGANPTGRLFGLPVYTTRNVPTNLGAADNESVAIVGNFSEGLILDHASITLDSSEHVFFTTNATIFRAEDQVGFTAARYPEAFNVIGGAGLVPPS